MKRLTPLVALIATALVGCGSGGDSMSSAPEGTPKSGTTTTGSPTGTPVPSGEAVTLRLKPKVGTIYVLENMSEAGGQSSSTTMTTKILESNANGVKMENVMSNATGPAAAMLNGFKMVIQASPMYQIQTVTMDSKDPQMAQMGKAMESSMKMMPIFPQEAVRVGETWNGSFDIGRMMTDMGVPASFKGDTNMDMVMTFKGIEEKEGRQVAVIRNVANEKITMVVNGEDKDMTMEIDGETYFDLETGMSLGSVTTSKTSVMGQDQISKNTIKLKEIK